VALIAGMKNNLLIRFIIIIVAVAIAAYCVWHYPLKGGIDLAGGTSLLYEVQIPENYQGDPAQLSGEVITTLRNRIDPNSQKNLIWRVVGGRRIQLQIPQASQASRDARKDMQKAETALGDSGISPQEVANVTAAKGAERAKLIATLSAGWPVRIIALERLGQFSDTLAAAEQKSRDLTAAGIPLDDELLNTITDTQNQIQRQRTDLFATNVDVVKVKSLLEAAADESKTARDELQQMLADRPAQRAQLESLLAAHAHFMTFKDQNTDDPEEIKRLLQGSGKLDFRICVAPVAEEAPAARDSLSNLGPRKPVGNTKWFEIDAKSADNFIDPATGRPHPSYVVQEWTGKKYILLYTDVARALTHDVASRRWKLTHAAPSTDSSSGQTAVSFELDGTGARYMNDLTAGNMEKPMCILLDDRAMQAPSIHGAISDRGQITFGKAGANLMQEVDNLVKTLNAGSLSAALVPEPISEQTVSSEMGDDNIAAGFRSAIIAVIAVIAFMLVYYTITGMFANIALMINLLITLSVMATMGWTFTLPGIAGVVLTLGMAVDANVLINERIREEVHKGGSLWMAVKQGYDKVFWTIFDANLTTSLTSIVLILVGSEEVRGFGITLLIGLIIHMFTALFVTRTFMVAAIKFGILRQIDDHSITEYFKEVFTATWLRFGRWPFMRVIHVTKIDWIGKRHIFWGISAVITIGGLVAFMARGQDAYDTEFRGGTEVRFSTPTVMTREHVVDKIKSIASDTELMSKYPELNALKDPVVQTEGTDGMHFRLITPIADTTERKVKNRFLAELAKQFPDKAAEAKIDVGGIEGDIKKRPSDTELCNSLHDIGRLVPIVSDQLQKNFTGIPNIPAVSVVNHQQGVAIYLDKMNPPQSVEGLKRRILAAKQSDTTTTVRTFDVIPVGPPVAAENADRQNLYTAFVVASHDEQIIFDKDNRANGWDKMAEQELRIVLISLEPRNPFTSVNSIDSVVAGEAKIRALAAIIISLVLIVIYVWIRFGGIRYGFGAILSLAHDAIVALAATVLAKYAAEGWFGDHIGRHLNISDFKINLTMIAAYLTVIGYSVNDTIVIFDRIRENRGKSHQPLTEKLVNDSINQCFGRTIWTTFTVFIVVLIMFIWGGEGVRGFSFAMLIGVFTGAYSTLAIASPMLLSVKEKLVAPKSLKFKDPTDSGPDGGLAVRTTTPSS
jgi:SecD/SecF fusion protein